MQIRSFGLTALLILIAACESLASPPLFRRAASTLPPSFPIALQELSSRREEVARVIHQPTLSARGPIETFECRPEQYRFFLDHPDRAVTVWRRLGAKCVSITENGGGQFGWADDLGSEVAWETVHKGNDLRIWYAHGRVRASPMLPMVGVEVVVVLYHREVAPVGGKPTIEHHADVFLHTDSKTAQLFARLMGTSSIRLAEQGLTQMQLFFGALCWYLDRHPDRAETLLEGLHN